MGLIPAKLYKDFKFNTLPKSFGQLKNLKSLEIHFGKFTSIPNCILELVGLERLVTTGSSLASVPEDIEKLTRLSDLDLSGNKLQQLPETLINLKNLKNVNLVYSLSDVSPSLRKWLLMHAKDSKSGVQVYLDEEFLRKGKQ